MYRAGRLRRVFRARGKLVGTSDFVVTKGYVQIRVVGFPYERFAVFGILNVTLLRCAVFVSIAVVGAWAPLALSVGDLSARGGLCGISRRWPRTARGRCAAPVSNGAPPLLGGPWASKLRPPSERSVPRRRLAPRFAG